MNEEQIKRIDEEIDRLFRLRFKINLPDLPVYIDGRIDSLKWVKENI